MPGYITYNKNEESLINYTLYTSNVEDGTQLYYDVVSVSSQNSSVTLNPSSLSMNESETISFSGSVVGIADNTNFYYEIIGTVNSSDFADGSLTGIVTVSNGIYIITKTLLPFDTDSPEETQENFQLTLRLGGNTGTIVGTSSTVYVNNIGFTSFTFNSGGTVGQYGPTLQGLRQYYGTSTYPWLNSTTYFNATGGIQLWTVPRTGTYRIVAAGARGGKNDWGNGGLGAIMQGDFSLVANQKIKIAVGQTSQFGGGGGTFVVNNTVGAATTSDILVIAGGGGGPAAYRSSQPQFSNATLSDPSNSSASWPSYVSDGTQASGGNGGGSAGGSGGGGGFLTNGALTCGGKSFLNGLEGGPDPGFGAPGGFGGGGGLRYPGGGGGGFSGGGGAGESSSGGTGGGGSSLNNGTNQSNSIANDGSGYVIITKL